MIGSETETLVSLWGCSWTQRRWIWQVGSESRPLAERLMPQEREDQLVQWIGFREKHTGKPWKTTKKKHGKISMVSVGVSGFPLNQSIDWREKPYGSTTYWFRWFPKDQMFHVLTTQMIWVGKGNRGWNQISKDFWSDLVRFRKWYG